MLNIKVYDFEFTINCYNLKVMVVIKMKVFNIMSKFHKKYMKVITYIFFNFYFLKYKCHTLENLINESYLKSIKALFAFDW